MSKKKSFSKKINKGKGILVAKVPPVSVNTPAAASHSPFTLKYLSALWSDHPLKPVNLLKVFGAFTILSSILAWVGMKGYFEKFILVIAGENMGPITAISLGASSLLIVSGVIAFRGAFVSRDGWVYRTFGIWLPRIALSSWGTLCGISAGFFLVAFLLGHPVKPYFPELCFRLMWFFWGIFVFMAITVTTSDSPGYNTPQFKRGTRVFAAIICVMMIGWFYLGALYINSLGK